MSHKLDRKRHRLKVLRKRRALKQRYMKLTQNDTLDPNNALSVLKDAEQIETVRRIARRLALRGIQTRFAPEPQ